MDKKKILIVEDEKDIARLIQYNLDKAGYTCEVASSGEAALSALSKHHVDLVILDVMLPGVDGLEVCRRIKKSDQLKDIPVLFLTAKGEEVDRVVGLELGADDYVVKPFSPRELGLRVKAILRRKDEMVSPADCLRIGDLLVDLSKIQVSVKGKPVELAAKEFELLTTLIKANGRVLSREHLLDAIWGYDKSIEIQTRTVDVHIRTLRKKLKGEADRIVTVKGYGYRFNH
jgi:DNA-binding response OmpR family regulator